jgi:hypothetical protein
MTSHTGGGLIANVPSSAQAAAATFRANLLVSEGGRSSTAPLTGRRLLPERSAMS